MTKLYIEHNPFSIETTFLVDEKEPEIQAFSQFKGQRFQQWVEKLFDELDQYFNGLSQISVEFKGLENDYLDLLEAANVAREKGMDIQLSHIPAENANERLAQIQKLVKEAKSHRLFQEKIEARSEISNDLDVAENKEFDIYVAATMSSGKSTLINAMLGSDLLPAANEATTATIAKIYDTDKPVGEYLGQRFNFNGDCVDPAQPINLDTLKEWNQKEDTLLIEIEGNIYGVKKRDDVRLVLSDTPGPNNSQTDEHSKTTMKHMKDTKRNPLILYILNATQLGIRDDKNTLREISEIIQEGGKQSKDRFIFVVNKMDVFDPEKGEDIEKVLENVRRYLMDNGIENPSIYPVSANLTRLLRKRDIDKDSLTRSERGDLLKMEDLFIEEPSMDLTQYMDLTNAVKTKLIEGKYSTAEYRSGLPAVEKVIDTYIEKYNLPERVFRAYRALNATIDQCVNEEELTKSLEMGKEELARLQSAIQKLREMKSSSANTEKYIKKLREKGIGLPKEIITKTNKMEQKVTKELREHSELFTGRVEPATARRRLSNLQEDVQFTYRNLQTTYETIFEQIDDLTGKALVEEYQRRIKDIFDDVAEFKLPQLEHMRSQMEFSFNLKLKNDEIDEMEEFSHTRRVKTGTRRVKVGERSTSKWYNPFSWGSKEDIYDTQDVYEDEDVYKTVKFVDLEDVWENRGNEIKNEFDKLTNEATKDIEAHHQKLVDEYIQFIEREFGPRFENMLKELENKIQDQKSLEKELKQADINLTELKEFKARLDQVIKL